MFPKYHRVNKQNLRRTKGKGGIGVEKLYTLVKVLAKVRQTCVGKEECVELQEELLLVGWLVGVVPDISSYTAPCRLFSPSTIA